MSAPLHAAMVRHSTLDPSLWPRAVRTLATLGFDAIDLPLVWREHERPDGSLDFTSAALDVAGFLDVVAGEGLRAVVRLGPWPGSDVEHLGLPDRVLHDRACQARTRRQNPVHVLDLPRLAPLPSVASARYRDAARAWVRAAAEVIAPRAHDGTVARVIVGHGPPAVLRDDVFEADHHPDARGDAPPVSPPHHAPLDAGLAEAAREARHLEEFLVGLRDAAVAGGVDERALALAITGSPEVSAAALRLCHAHTLSLAVPPPRAGATGIWRLVRLAMSMPGGVHLDLRAGGPPFEPPTRATHTLQAARVAFAAGARDVTVQAGCAGSRWIGALLDERADPRAPAARWSALLAWAKSLPRGSELGPELPVRPRDALAARAATGVHPLPLNLLAWVGMRPHELTAATADAPDDALARALTDAAVPHRAVCLADEAAAEELSRDEALARWAPRAPRVTPPGSASVRAVETERGPCLVVASMCEGPIRVAAPAEGRWFDEQGAVEGERALPGGEVIVMREARA